MQWADALETTAFAAALRNSVWVYPLINAAHILGVALLVGAMVPLDLRLLGVWPGVPLAPLRRVLTVTAAAGLALAVAAGSLLFIARAGDYAASPLFLSKLTVVAIGVTNALALQIGSRMPSAIASTTGWCRMAAAISLLCWLSALTLGRLIGYF